MSTKKPSPQLGQAVPPPVRDLKNLGARGRKNRGTHTPEPPRSTTVSPKSDVAAPEAGKDEKAKPAPPRPARGVSSEADKVLTVGRNVFLPSSLYDQVRDARVGASRLTATQVVLNAVKATYKQLPDLVAEDLAPTVVHGELWDEIQAPPTEAKRTLQIKPTRQQLAVIDGLVNQTGARDRSHMLTVALTAYLGT